MIFLKYWLNKILKLISPVSAFFNMVLEDFKLHMACIIMYWTALIRISPSDYHQVPRRELSTGSGLTRGQRWKAAASSQLPTPWKPMEPDPRSHEPGLSDAYSWDFDSGLSGAETEEKDCLEASLNMVSVVCDQTALPLLMRVGWRIKHNVHYRSIAGGMCRIRQRWHQAVWRES